MFRLICLLDGGPGTGQCELAADHARLPAGGSNHFPTLCFSRLFAILTFWAWVQRRRFG
jgi:hypothetical protein